MAHATFNYLRAYRKRWGLSEEELSHLLGGSRASLVCRLEQGTKKPSGEILIGCEVVFGIPPRVLFPDLYEGVEDAVMGRVAPLSVKLEGKTDQTTVRKRRLFEEMIKRATDSSARI